MSIPISIPTPNRLPTPVEDYFDREKEVNTIVEFLKKDQEDLSSGKVCIVHGSNGMGKTGLCHVVANQLLQVYPDAQVYLKIEHADGYHAQLYKIFELIIHLFEPFAFLSDDLGVLHTQYLSVLKGNKVLIVLDDLQNTENLICSSHLHSVLY
jgi:Cdc6-like AAA superfamily ATPase